MQWTRVRSLVWEEDASKPCGLEQLSPRATTSEPGSATTEACAPQSLCSATREVAVRSWSTPAKSSLCSLRLEKARVQQQKTDKSERALNWVGIGETLLSLRTPQTPGSPVVFYCAQIRASRQKFLFFFLINLFGCVRSYLWHVRSLIFIAACRIFSFSLWDLVP